jgi:hypothetical protein
VRRPGPIRMLSHYCHGCVMTARCLSDVACVRACCPCSAVIVMQPPRSCLGAINRCCCTLVCTARTTARATCALTEPHLKALSRSISRQAMQ